MHHVQAASRRLTPARGASRWLTRLLLALIAALLLLPAGATPVQGQGDAPPVPAARKAGNVAVITIRGEIDARQDGTSVMATSIERRIATAIRAGADAIVFDIDTPGGAVPAVRRITNLIKGIDPAVRTVAWINPDAISGGAIIALACQEIVVNDPATMGDAMPIAFDPIRGASAVPNEQLLKKVLPLLITDVLDSTRRYNRDAGAYARDEYLAMSIIANDLELWWIRNRQTGQSLAIDRREFELLFPGQNPDTPPRLASAPGTGTPNPSATPPSPPPPGTALPSGSTLLAAVGDQAELNQTIRSQRPVLREADRGNWELITRVTDGSGPAVFNADDLVFFGLAANGSVGPDRRVTLNPIRNDADLKSFFAASHVRRLDRNWSEGLVLFLTNFWVRGVLIAIFLIALFVEMTHPGAMLPGIIAAAALVGIIAPPLLIGMASWWEVGAILLGIALIALEIFIFPGFGIPGIIGLIALFGGLVATFIPGGQGLFPDTARGQADLLWGAVTLILSVTSAAVVLWLFFRNIKSIPAFNRLILKNPGDDDTEVSTLVNLDSDDAPTAVGEVGVSITPLRPAGRVQIDDRVIDAVSEFGLIPAGQRVRVSSVNPFRITVERVQDAPAPSPTDPPPHG